MHRNNPYVLRSHHGINAINWLFENDNFERYEGHMKDINLGFKCIWLDLEKQDFGLRLVTYVLGHDDFDG